MIQLPGYQPVSQTQVIASASGEAAAAPSRALQSVAQGIGSLGDVAGTIATEMMRVDNGRKLSEARQTLAQNYAQFQIELQTETDPQARLDKTNSFLQGQRSLLYDPDHAPIVSQAIESHLSDFTSSASITAAQDAAQLITKRATQAFQNEVATATRNNDREGYEKAKTTARESLGLTPEEIFRMDEDFDRSVAFNSTTLAIENYPADTLESLQSDSFLIDNPGLYPEDREKLIRYAKQQIQTKRGEEIELLEEAMFTGKLTPPDIEAAEHLTAKDRAAFSSSLQKQEQEAPISQQEYLQAWKITDVLREARNDPKVSDEQYRVIHNEARTDILNRIPSNLQGDLKRELGYLTPAGRSTVDNPTGTNREDLNSIARAQIKRAHEAGLYGNTDTDAPYEEQEKAARKAEDLRRAAQKFIESRDIPPTVEEVRRHVETLNGQSIDGDTPLIPLIPERFSIDADALREILTLPGNGENIPPGAATINPILLPPKP